MDQGEPYIDVDAQKEGEVYTLSPHRWPIAMIFAILFASNAMIWMTYAPIPTETRETYKISTFFVNVLGMVFQIVATGFLLPAAYLMKRLGLRKLTLAAALLSGIGGWGRCIAPLLSTPYPMLLASQAIAAIAPCILLVAPPYLATQWFGIKERTLATALCSFSNIFGIGVIFVLAPYMSITTLQIVVASIASVPVPLLFLFFRDRPETPPSAAAVVLSYDFFKSLKETLSNAQFLQMNLAWGLGFGIFVAILTLLPQILSHCGFTSHMSGILGALFIFSGAIGAGIAGVLIDKTRKYKYGMLLGYGGAVIALCLLSISLTPALSGLAVVALLFGGLFALSLLPVTLETGIEMTFPAPEPLVTGVLMTVGQVFGVVMLIVGSLLPSIDVSWMLFASASTAFIIIMLILKPEYRRMAYEEDSTRAHII